MKRARARASRAMGTATRVAGDEEGEGVKGDGNSNEGDERAMATRVAGKV
jgi:hypothetical protein